MSNIRSYLHELRHKIHYFNQVPGGKSRGLSLKVACHVSSQAAAYMVKMFSR